MGDSAGFEELVRQLVAAIPAGKVATYGQLAFLAGRPECSRLAGRILAGAPEGLPCHRVVNHAGRTVPGWPEQRMLLEREGVRFKPNGCVKLALHLWEALPVAEFREA